MLKIRFSIKLKSKPIEFNEEHKKNRQPKAA